MKINELRPQTKKNLVTLAIALAGFAASNIAVAVGAGSWFRGLLVPICIYVILAVSLNLTVGILGELSLGHAGFMCVGAYASSLFSVCTKTAITSTWIRFPLAILIGALAAAVFGFIVGIPVLRLNGDYLAIVTLAFGEIIKTFVNNSYLATDKNGVHLAISSTQGMNLDETTKTWLINGPAGIDGTPRDSGFTVAFVLVMITLIVIMNLVDSRAGRAIMAIRDNRIAAESVGINIAKYKLIAIVTSAFFAGIAGALYSHNLSTLKATTNNFGYNMSIMILVFVVLGGMGSIRGSMIAAVVLYCLPECLRSMKDFRMLIYAIVLIGMMLMSSNEKIMNAKTRLTESVRGLLSFGSKNRKEGTE